MLDRPAEYQVTYISPSGRPHVTRTDDFVAALGRFIRFFTNPTPPPIHLDGEIGWEQSDIALGLSNIRLIRYVENESGYRPVELIAAFHPAQAGRLGDPTVTTEANGFHRMQYQNRPVKRMRESRETNGR